MRVKSRWHNKQKTRSPEELGATLAFISWRIATNAIKNMEKSGFGFLSGAVQLNIIEEFSAFLIQIVDRLVYQRIDEEARERLVSTLALRLVDTMVDNQLDVLGPGDYRGALIGRLNERLDDYAGLTFNEDDPGFGFLRYLGDRVKIAMAGQDDRWVVEQIVEIEAPEAVETIRKALRDVRGEGGKATRRQSAGRTGE